MDLPAHLKETGELLDFGISLGNKLGKAGADGVFDFKDAPLFIEPMMKLPAAIEDSTAIFGELSAMTEEDKKVLMHVVKNKFDIPQDEVEKRVEQGLAFGLAVLVYLKTWL